MKRKKIEIKKRQLFSIREGLNLLNDLRGPRIGMLRAEIAQVVNPLIEVLKAGSKNEEFEKLQEQIMLVTADTEEERQSKVREIERKNSRVIREKYDQNREYSKILDEVVELNVDQIPLSYLTKETPSAAYELLLPLIDKTK